MNITYLDNASTSYPKPSCLVKGMEYYLRQIGGNPFRANHKLARQGAHLVFETRKLISYFLGTKDPNKISFTYNATYALNILLKGFLKPGDHVITSSYDHNSVLRPLNELKKKNNISYDVWTCDRQGKFSFDALEKLVTPKTRLIFFSHASNVIGSLIPLKSISHFAKKREISLGIDCTQSIGHIDLNFEDLGVDMAAGTCHKALLGPPGLGFLYVRDENKVESLIQGGGGFLGASLEHPEVSPAKYEAGTINYLGIAGLYNSLEWLVSRKHSLEKKLHSLVSYLKEELRKIPWISLYGSLDEETVPIISFNVHNVAASQIEYILENNYNIFVRSGLHCASFMHKALGTLPNGTIRISFGPFNQEKDVKKVIEALSQIHGEIK